MTISSMTGFARAQGHLGNLNWCWEIRSVNGKGLDIRVRVPSGYEALDVAARAAAAKIFNRGNISMTLTVNALQVQAGFRVNRDVLDQLLEVMGELRQKLPDARPASLDGILGLRGVIEAVEEVDDEDAREKARKAMTDSLNEGLAGLKQNRDQEGAGLAKVLSSHLETIEGLCSEAQNCAATRPEAIRARLKRQLEDVLDQMPALPEDRLAQEAAVLMVKADIREELDRLGAHIENGTKLLKQGGACGRKLDFLCQEFNREVNTICSKSQDVQLTNIGLELKTVIDQFREQVQNIE